MARGSTLVQWKSRHIGRFVCGFGAIAGGADAKQIFESADLRVGYSHAYHNWAWTGGAFQLGGSENAHSHEPGTVSMVSRRQSPIESSLASPLENHG